MEQFYVKERLKPQYFFNKHNKVMFPAVATFHGNKDKTETS